MPLPSVSADEPDALKEYRASPGDERKFMQLRRKFREAEDWTSMAKLLVLHASAIDKPNKVAELCVQAYELWLERVKDREAAAAALARALVAQPNNQRAYDRLGKLYKALSWSRERVALLEWRIASTPLSDGATQARLQAELGALHEHDLLRLDEAIAHYDIALRHDPGLLETEDHLIDLHLAAGAWGRARELLERAIAAAEASGGNPARVCDLHLKMSRIISEQDRDIANAARHLQAAIKAQPNSLEALRGFGLLYLGSGKASEDGMHKAAGIFVKAAQIAQRDEDLLTATRLLRRSLTLRPDFPEAAALLEEVLTARELWLDLDDLYRQQLSLVHESAQLPLLLRRAELLEQRLSRREEARIAYEQASRYQGPHESAWTALDRLYTETRDWTALVGLLEYQAEQIPDQMEISTLLRAARVYREQLDNDERAAFFYYMVLERDPFNPEAFEGYKEHWRRKHNWAHLRDLILYQIEQASAYGGAQGPLSQPEFAEEFVELADICERRLGDVDGALDACSRMAAAYPSDARPRDNIGRIQKRTRMWDNMVRVHEGELERTTNPKKRIEVLKRLVQIYRDRQVNPTRAIELYNEILAENPDDVQSTRALTALYDRAGDYAQVINMLRDQYERSRSNTERLSLLRRMAELWHHELDAPDEALWASEEMLGFQPRDTEALHRVQLIHQERGMYPELLDALDRELKIVAANDEKATILRRMARIAERELGDHDYAASIWGELLALTPDNLEVIDKMVSVYEESGRYEELSTLLHRAASSANTLPVRQLDYWMRLGMLALHTLDDPDLARQAFEQVLELRPEHRGALQSVAHIYREEGRWAPLADVLGALQKQAADEDEEYSLAWERAEVLGSHLDFPGTAANILAELTNDNAQGNIDVNRRLLDHLAAADMRREYVTRAEVLLLGTYDRDARRELYDGIATAWRELGDQAAALSTLERATAEFGEDAGSLLQIARISEDLERWADAYEAMGRALAVLTDAVERIDARLTMARLAEEGIGDSEAALEQLSAAIAEDPEDERLYSRLESFADRHGRWDVLMSTFDERFDRAGDRADLSAQLGVCMHAAKTAEDRLEDARLAFNWIRRGYILFIQAGIDAEDASHELDRLAKGHGLWVEMLDVIEQQFAVQMAMADGGDDLGVDDDVVALLVRAAEIAEKHLGAPGRAVDYLARALRVHPDDTELAQRLEATAREHEQWAALIDVQRRKIEDAETDLGRFDGWTQIAKLQEVELETPKAAFETLRTAWLEMANSGSTLSEEADDLLGELAERHELWSQLAQHRRDIAQRRLDAGDRLAGLDGLVDAASILGDRANDPLAALRMLASGCKSDPEGDVLLPRIREFSTAADEASGEGKLGTLALLAVIESVYALAQTRDDKLALLRERAQLREERLDDGPSAMAEWLRILRLLPDDGEAAAAVERLASAHDAWDRLLLFTGWRLQKANERSEQVAQYERLAELYEHQLARPEYAFRARLEAWRLDPSLPPRRPAELDAEQATLWRLAGVVGEYGGPPLPRDPLLNPTLEAPETRDRERWRETGEPPVFVGAGSEAVPIAAPPMPTEELGSLEAAADDAATSFNPFEDDVPSQVQPDLAEVSASMLIEDLEEVEELEELDEIVELDELEEVEELDVVEVNTKTPPPAPGEGGGFATLPELLDPLLPARPKVPSAWAELDAAYAEVPTSGRAAKVEVELARARMWESGAEDIEAAFVAHERAATIDFDDDDALRGLYDLAERHGRAPRLVAALETIRDAAALPEHLIAIDLRLADLHADAGDAQAARDSLERILEVDADHTVALSRLIEAYRTLERWPRYAELEARLIEAEKAELTADDYVQRQLDLQELIATKLSRREDSVEALYMLLRNYGAHESVHRKLAQLLERGKEWQRAIDVYRGAATSLGDEAFARDAWQRTGEIYRRELELPDRAIEAFNELRELDPEHDEALRALAELYTETGRHEQALPLLERRIELTSDPHERVGLMVAKSHAQLEVGDEPGATATLEAVRSEAPNDDAVTVGLAELYRKTERTDEARRLLEERVEAIADPKERLPMALALARLHREDRRDPAAAIAVVAGLREAEPLRDDDALLELHVELARELDDVPQLVKTLASSPKRRAWLEAAHLARHRLEDRERSARLYSKVLAALRELPPAEAATELVAAVEGLAELRLDEGDVDGASSLLDEELSRVEDPAITARLLGTLGRLTFRTTGDLDKARARFDAALEQDPNAPEPKVGLAEILLEADEVKQAEPLVAAAVDTLTLENAEDTAPLVRALLVFARVLDAQQKKGEAYRRLSAALRHAPDDFAIRAAIVKNRRDARRHRDAITAADQLAQHLEQRKGASGRLELSDEDRRYASDVFVWAAECERESKRTDAALARLERALELDPNNPRALSALLPEYERLGRLAEAAHLQARLAASADDPARRIRALFEAGRLFHEAASAEPDANAEELRKDGFGAIRKALAAARDHSTDSQLPAITDGELEAAFLLGAEHGDPQTCTAALDAMLDRDSLHEGEQKLVYLLEGVRLALSADIPEAAERYAMAAQAHAPDSAGPIQAHVDVLEATSRAEEVELLASAFFERVDDDPSTLTEAERESRVGLWLKLSEIRDHDPDQATHALEQAAALYPEGLPLSVRRRLAELHKRIGVKGPKVLDNHRALLALDPTSIDSLEAVAQHHVEQGDLLAAHAAYALLAVLAPDHGAAREFLSTHAVDSAHATTVSSAALVAPTPAGAGVPEVLSKLWESGNKVLGPELSKIEFASDARVSPVGESLLARSWGDVLKRLGQTKVALVDDPSATPPQNGATRPEDSVFFVGCQQPPVIVALPRAHELNDAAALGFALARALHFTRPETVLAVATDKSTFARIMSATLQAFHPRHAARKQAARTQSDDAVAKLGQELARKLPIRVAREMTAAFEAHGDEPFDSRGFRAWVRRSANRIGLTATGDLGGALKALGVAPSEAAERARSDHELRELLAFAISADYVEHRRQLGATVETTEAN